MSFNPWQIGHSYEYSPENSIVNDEKWNPQMQAAEYPGFPGIPEFVHRRGQKQI